MKKILLIFIVGSLFTVAYPTSNLQSLNKHIFSTKKDWQIDISERGTIQKIIFRNIKRKNDTIPFFSNEKQKQGPSFYMILDGKEYYPKWISCGRYTYKSRIKGIECVLQYAECNGYPSLIISLENKSHTIFQPEKAGIKFGIDTYMDKYPEWNGKFFPTFMRNEKTHFYGYFESPQNRMLAITCSQPIASWSLDYNLGYQDPPPYWFMGHRIESFNLDLLNRLPLPSHNPQSCYQLLPEQKKKWTISLIPIKKNENFEEEIATAEKMPVLQIKHTSYSPGETAMFSLWGTDVNHAVVKIIDDKGYLLHTDISSIKGGVSVYVVLPKIGLYTIKASAGNKQVEGILSVHAPWKWEIEKARVAAYKYHQKATTQAESYYGFYSAFIAAKNFPQKDLDKKLSARFDMIYRKTHAADHVTPINNAVRIQNTSTFIGELVQKYEAEGQINDLQRASQCADWLIRYSQRPDGAYMNGKTVYTSVIYIAKSLLELYIAEQKASLHYPEWKEIAERHFLSAEKAIKQLVSANGNFQTEGELTFEDGMISCSALQIGMLAVLEKDKATRARYRNAMLQLLKSHDCLTQLHVPDARMRQATLRWWEAQYNAEMLPNMLCSPHGWSAWRAYATFYAYLLTGNEKWLIQTFNAAGAFSSLIDYKTGKLRWAFVADPFVEVQQACSADKRYNFDDFTTGNPHPLLYDTRKFIIGEQYVDMISDWQTSDTQDNDVHEVFKFMSESVLTNAFIIEQPDGTIKGYNCKVQKKGNCIQITSDEPQIINLHCNLKNSFRILFKGKSYLISKKYFGWLAGGYTV